MKFLMLLALISSPLLAQEDFAQMKQKMSARLDQRISHLQEAKSCVSAAADVEALKACRKQMKEKGQAMKEEMKANRQDWKNKRKDKKK